MLSAALVRIDPSRLLRAAVIQKRDLEHGGRGGQHLLDQSGLLLVGRVELDLDLGLLLLQSDLLPHLAQILLDIGGIGHAELMIAVDLDIAEHRVRNGRLQLLSPALQIRLLEVVVDSGKLLALILGPLLVGRLAEQLLQHHIAALFGELDHIELAALIKVDELIVQLHLFVSGARGKNTGDLADDVDRSEEL